jgi:uncharacterized repeat protein (TIGR04138 family)
MQDIKFHEVVEVICKEDTRYDRRAYGFVRAGLDFTVGEIRKKIPLKTIKAGGPVSRHISAPQLLEGMRAFTLDQFGPLSKTVLNEWGVKRCCDFGEIVYNLIEHGIFSKTPEDNRGDFTEVFSFENAFEKPFWPKNRRGRQGRRKGQKESAHACAAGGEA